VGSGSSVAQGIADMAQSWVHLARDMAPQVPELPGVIQQQVSALNGTEITEERLSEVARAITKRVDDSGHPEVAATLLRRMGRAMYELLLLLATQEELRTMGMLMQAAAAPATKPENLPAPKTTPPRPAVAPHADPTIQQRTPSTAQPPAQSGPPPLSVTGAMVATAPAAAKPLAPLPPRAASPTAPTPTQANPAHRATAPAVPPSAEPSPPSEPRVEAYQPRVPAAFAKPGEPPSIPAPQTARQLVQPARPEPATIAANEAAPAASAAVGPAEAEEEAVLWGFDPAAREVPETVRANPETQVIAPDGDQLEPALAVESSPANGVADSSSGRPGILGVASPHGWTVRLSPRAAQERDRRLAKRLIELPALIEGISTQVHEQRRAVSDRGMAKQAVRTAAEQSAPTDLQTAGSRIGDLLEGGRLPDAAALALRTAEAFPGAAAAELACRAGEASRDAKDDELATLCFTTAVLAAPPCESACWQLAGMALEQRDPRLAPIWMEFLARLLRVRGADEDAVVVYRQLLNLTPRRQDVSDMLRLASLTGVLPD